MDFLRRYYRRMFRKIIHKDIPTFIGGSTLGGRIASEAALWLQKNSLIDGVIALGFQFYPKGWDNKIGIYHNHFKDIKVPFLIIQGERDIYGEFANVSQLKSSFPDNVFLYWIKDGDDLLKSRTIINVLPHENWEKAVEIMILFICKTKSIPLIPII